MQKIQIHWYGHAAFKITTPKGHVILIDPWITNPANPSGKQDLEKLTKVDAICITHGHTDHVGEAAVIAQKTNAKLVTTYDLGLALIKHNGYPKELVGFDTQGHFGGELVICDGEVSVIFVPAIHGSHTANQDGISGDNESGGSAGGFLIHINDGPTLYHTGDTDLFSDMALIPHHYPVTAMLCCIGGHFTMNPRRAAHAVELVKPKKVIPMHYGTFPMLTGTPEALKKELKQRKVSAEVIVMNVGETISL